MITVPGMIASLAGSSATAERVAVLGRETVTFAQLYDRALRRVSELREIGVAEGSIVAIVAFNEVEVFEQLVACGHLGAALMPLSPALPAADLAHLLEKADTAVCLVSPLLSTDRVEALGAGGVRTVVMGPAVHEPAHDVDLPHEAATCWVSPTGGSTGTPRLYAISHERLVTNVLLNALEWDWRRYDAQIALSPLAHGIGFSQAVGQLVTGGTVALVERYSPSRSIELASELGSCWTAVVPTMLHDLLEADAMLPGIDLLVSAGAPLSVRLRDRALAAGARLIEYYGSTELGWVTWREHVAGDPREAVVGLPTLGSEVRIVGPDGGPAPAGAAGLVEKRGRPYAIPVAGGPSAYRANTSVWETSGDLGYVDADGALILVGRQDDMLVVGGQNVFPVEVEAVLRQHPDVVEALVRGEPDERLGAQVVAFVEAVPGRPVDPEELGRHCAELLPKFKRPARIALVGNLPRNTAGKVARSARVGQAGGSDGTG